MVVALAGNILTGLSKGLRDGFTSYASVSLAGIFEKFKEKKLNVVNSLRDASDAIYLTVSSVCMPLVCLSLSTVSPVQCLYATRVCVTTTCL